MSLADKWAERVYRFATTRNRLKTILTPVGITFWFGLGVLLVFASLWLDRLLPLRLPFAALLNIFLSIPLMVIGAVLCLWSVYSFSKARGTPFPGNPPPKLVTSGLYTRIRNPMLLGWFIMLFGLGILLNSFTLIFIFTPLFICLNILYIKTVEEKEMEKKFGKEYLNYKASVPLFIPRFGRRK
jgi:protein-S-isoprenylcysteine O-methyltransferase Ste14